MKKNNPTWPADGLHRLKAIRKREGISLRSIARRMSITMSKARDQEEGLCDLRISDLYRWQTALKVPMSELLDSTVPSLSEDIRQRACLLRVVRTAKSLAKNCRDGREHGLARQIVDQLHKLMPELKEVPAWPEGQTRPRWDLGRAGDEISMSEWMLPDSD